jgi:dTDP-4-dehydrorhamnose reductase
MDARAAWMITRRKTLVLGASSFVGRHVMTALPPDEVIATCNLSHLSGAVHFNSTTMDLSDVVECPEEIACAILLIGDTKPDSCFSDKFASRQLNVISIKRILDRLRAWDIFPIFTSSEFVYSGGRRDNREEDNAQPILLYGQQKLEVEHYIATQFPAYSVLRLGKVYGETPGDHTMFTNWMNILLEKSSSVIRCAADQRFSAVFVGDVVAAIKAAMNRRLDGVFNVGGPRGHSRLEYLHMLVDRVRALRSINVEIAPCSIHDFNLPEKRPVDVSMAVGKLIAASSLVLREPEESCARIASAMLQD